jgi:uncharacterized protein (DUF302 family)
MISRVEVERFSLTSARSFDEVLAAINDAVGHPEMAQFWSATQQARTVGELENSIQKALGRTGLMSFVQFDHGAIVRKATGQDKPRMVRLVVGNPLIMQEMAKHVPDAGSYAPVTVLVDERSDGVHLSYDRMASFLAPYENFDALAVARNLDKKVEALLSECGGLSQQQLR